MSLRLSHSQGAVLNRYPNRNRATAAHMKTRSMLTGRRCPFALEYTSNVPGIARIGNRSKYHHEVKHGARIESKMTVSTVGITSIGIAGRPVEDVVDKPRHVRTATMPAQPSTRGIHKPKLKTQNSTT